MIDQYLSTNEVGFDNREFIYRNSSFGKLDQKMTDLEKRLKKHGLELDLEEFMKTKKDMLFSEKKQRE